MIIALLVQAQGDGGGGDPFWMVPGPVKWAAGNLGGIFANINPWKGQPAEQTPESQAHQLQATEVSHLLLVHLHTGSNGKFLALPQCLVFQGW